MTKKAVKKRKFFTAFFWGKEKWTEWTLSGNFAFGCPKAYMVTSRTKLVHSIKRIIFMFYAPGTF